MQIAQIVVSGVPGPLSVNIACPRTAQALTGILKRYLPDKTLEGQVGEFLPSAPTVQIGSLVALKDHFFLLKGAVLAVGDTTPTPYEVVVTILSNGQPIHAEVPTDGGSGSVGQQDQGFVYRFQIVEA